MKIGTFLFLLYFNSYITTEVETPLSVKTFYDGMKELSRVSDANRAYDVTKTMKECFYGIEKSSSGCFLPNDFRFFEYDRKNPSHRDSLLNSTTYVNRLSDYIYKEHVLRVDCKILKNEYKGEQPDFFKGKMATSKALITTCVEKTYRLGRLKKIFNDTVYTDCSNGKIYDIRNGNGITVINIGSLRVKAALAYQLKHYYEAYQCYEQIIAINAKDADALYRIGLMTYYQQGCDFSKKSVARKKGMEYMKRAQRNGYYSGIGDKAENVLHNWKYVRI